MGPKRGRTTPGASTSKSRRQKGNPQNPHDIEFADEQQRLRYNTLLKRGILSTRYLDETCLHELGLWDDVAYLLGRVGWLNFVKDKYPTYERLTLEFLSSLDAVLFTGVGVTEGKITFRLFNQSHTLTLAQLNEIFGFPEGGARIVPKHCNLTPFWTSIARSTTQRPYDPSLSRASAIYNPCFRYLQRFMAFTIFGRGESDGVMCQRELYLLCAMVEGHKVDTGAFMIHHMCRAARATGGKIVFGGLITTFAYGLGLGEFVAGLRPLHPSASINLDACLHMKLIGRKGDRLWLCFQDNYLFPLPNPDRTTIHVHANWCYLASDFMNFDDHQLATVGDADTVPPIPIQAEPARDNTSSHHPHRDWSAELSAIHISLASLTNRVDAIAQEQHRQGQLLDSIHNMMQSFHEWQRSHDPSAPPPSDP